MTLAWIGTSWKMNKTLAEAISYAEYLANFVPSLDRRIQPFVIPSYTCGREVKKTLSNTRVKVGAQNMHWADSGAWTGEISPLMLRDCCIDLVEIGHSERREHFGETDHTVGLKTAAAVKHGLVPLICVGETLDQRTSGKTERVLVEQVRGALQFLGDVPGHIEILFAYEPVWAIGEQGIPASPDYADTQQGLIKAIAGSLLPTTPRVLYGGSVHSGNVAELVVQTNVDGLFIGRSAWSEDGFVEILQRAASALWAA